MSHFTVMVIGQEPEEQLEKYDENLEMPRYIKYTKQQLIDKFRKDKSEFKERCYDAYIANPEVYSKGKNENHIKYLRDGKFMDEFNWTDEQILDEAKDDYQGDIDEEYNVWSTYNPDSKWDWYQLGGRWSGMLKMKPLQSSGTSEIYDAFMEFTTAEMEEFVRVAKVNLDQFRELADKYKAPVSGLLKVKVRELIEQDKVLYHNGIHGEKSWMSSNKDTPKDRADAAIKKNIDFEGMRKDAAESAAKTYDIARNIMGDMSQYETFETVVENAKGDADLARTIYWDQPACVNWKKARSEAYEKKDQASFPFSFMSSPDNFLLPKEEYIQDAVNSVCITFALVKDGIWYQKGEMGWFGMSTDEMTQEEWNKKVHELIDSVSDDTLISIYDCHI